ncbi:MAG: choice-of-anchor D domain-containing protein [Myxococcota bacterium]
MMRFTLPVLLCGFAAGCSEFDLVFRPDELQDPECNLTVQTPARIDFGAISVRNDDPVTQQLQIVNNSNCDMNIYDLELQADGRGSFRTGPLFQPVLEANGGQTSIDVVCDPVTDGSLDGMIRIRAGASDFEDQSVEKFTELVCQGQAPQLSVTPDDFTFDPEPIGCEERLPVTISNIGSEVLEVRGIDNIITASAELRYDMELNELFPWALEPGQSRDIAVYYEPTDNIGDTLQFRVQSNDPLFEANGYPAIYDGNAAEPIRQTDIFEVPLKPQSDIIFAVDTSCSMKDAIAGIQNNFEVFTDALDKTDTDYRIFVVVEDSGIPTGDVAYIDRDNAENASDIIEEMLSGPKGFTAEMGLTMLEIATAANRSNLREDAELNLIAISDEPEQTLTKDYTEFVADFQALKDDDRKVQIHGIGGDAPNGCDTAKAFTNVFEATEATGGTFASICSRDWAARLDDLAAETVVELNVFDLSRRPVQDSITVSVNTGSVEGDWVYDSTFNSIVFASGKEPPGAATVSVSYIVQTDCD